MMFVGCKTDLMGRRLLLVGSRDTRPKKVKFVSTTGMVTVPILVTMTSVQSRV